MAMTPVEFELRQRIAADAQRIAELETQLRHERRRADLAEASARRAWQLGLSSFAQRRQETTTRDDARV